MTDFVIHRANSRGHADHGWLNAHHTFSFAGYYDPQRIHFGVLRVLNDDLVAPEMGFGTHPHDNMEIITIPLKGQLRHRDSMGNTSVIMANEIQVMSAGTGIQHSEFNSSDSETLNLLQIWVFPKVKGVTPRYQQIALNPAARHNTLQQVLSPNPDDEGVWIYQDAWFHLGTFDNEFESTYQLKKAGNGIYIFVIKGEFTINNQLLGERDGMGIQNTSDLQIKANTQDAEILIMEVPMHL